MRDRRQEILKRDFSNAFIEKMKNAIEMSHYKYGWANKTYPELAQAYKCAKERLEAYEKTHNKEYLIDVANFVMLEFLYPAFSDAKYTPTDSDKSIGLAGVYLTKNLWRVLKMSDRDRLEKLYEKAVAEYEKTNKAQFKKSFVCDYLIANGVILPPCRCKDCTYLRESDETNRMFCTYHDNEFETFPNHYCSQGVGMVKGV